MLWGFLAGLFCIHEQVDTEIQKRKHQPEAQKTIQHWNNNSEKLKKIQDKINAIGLENSEK